MAERVQQEWLESLRQQAIEPVLSFALLARSIEEEPATAAPLPISPLPQGQTQETPRQPSRQGTMFFNLLSWPGERYREDFYANEISQNIRGLLNRTAMVHVLTLDPM
jgi:hypothetical protein